MWARRSKEKDSRGKGCPVWRSSMKTPTLMSQDRIEEQFIKVLLET